MSFAQVFTVYRDTIGVVLTPDVTLQALIDGAVTRMLRIVPTTYTVKISTVFMYQSLKYQVQYRPYTDAPVPESEPVA